jgi:hypothetical protein
MNVSQFNLAKNFGVATHWRLALSIVARDVCDRAIADCYQITALQQVPLDPAAIDERTILAIEIYKTNTVQRINDHRMTPAHYRAGHRHITQRVAANENIPAAESLLLDNYAIHAGDESASRKTRAVDSLWLRLRRRKRHFAALPKELVCFLDQVRRYWTRALFVSEANALTTKSIDVVGYSRTDLMYESDRVKLEYFTNVCDFCRLNFSRNVLPRLNQC